MTDHPDKPAAGSEERRSGAPAKDERPADPGGHRSKAGTTYGDYVPDRGQPRRNDDRDQDPAMGDYDTGGGDLEHRGGQPVSPHPQAADAEQGGTTRTGSSGEQVPDPDEAAHESRVNKTFDTTHVHSGTTSRKV